jgi:hypothetical protein
MILKSINDIIGFLSSNRYTDPQSINEICKAALNKTFMPFSIGEPKQMEYYIYWLNVYQDKQKKGEDLPVFIDMTVPFDIKQLYKV